MLLNDNLKNKTVLFTGATRGIGKTTVLALAKLGARLLVHGRSEASVNPVVEELSSRGCKVQGVFAELNSEAGIDSVIDQVEATGWPVDVLYNNAGWMHAYEPMEQHDFKRWQQCYTVNVFAPAQLIRHFLPKMRERGWGRIINTSSDASDQQELLPYASSKAAIDKITEDLGHTIEEKTILVNCIHPGWLKTDMGGQWAPEDVEACLPGMLIPALLADGEVSGKKFWAPEYKNLRLKID